MVSYFKLDGSAVFGVNDIILDLSIPANERDLVYQVMDDNKVIVVRQEMGVDALNGFLPKGSWIGLIDLTVPVKYRSTVSDLTVHVWKRCSKLPEGEMAVEVNNVTKTIEIGTYVKIEKDDVKASLIQIVPGFANTTVTPGVIKGVIDDSFDVVRKPMGSYIIRSKRDVHEDGFPRLNNTYFLLSGLASVKIGGNTVRLLTPGTSVFGEAPFIALEKERSADIESSADDTFVLEIHVASLLRDRERRKRFRPVTNVMREKWNDYARQMAYRDGALNMNDLLTITPIDNEDNAITAAESAEAAARALQSATTAEARAAAREALEKAVTVANAAARADGATPNTRDAAGRAITAASAGGSPLPGRTASAGGSRTIPPPPPPSTEARRRVARQGSSQEE